jgi:hypothetical protein
MALPRSEPVPGSIDDYRNRLLRHEAKWEIITLSTGEYHCSWVNPDTGSVEQVKIPRGFNPHDARDVTFDNTKETCKIEYAENASLTMPTSLFRALRAEIQAPRSIGIPIEDLEAILRNKRFPGPVPLKMKKAWSALLGGKETVPEIADTSGIVKDTAYKYVDLWLEYNIVLRNGPRVSLHPDIYHSTKTED